VNFALQPDITRLVTANIVAAAFRALDNPPNTSALRVPPLWDGHTADRILEALIEKRG